MRTCYEPRACPALVMGRGAEEKAGEGRASGAGKSGGVVWKLAVKTAGDNPIGASNVRKTVPALMKNAGIKPKSTKKKKGKPEYYRIIDGDLMKIRERLDAGTLADIAAHPRNEMVDKIQAFIDGGASKALEPPTAAVEEFWALKATGVGTIILLPAWLNEEEKIAAGVLDPKPGKTSNIHTKTATA